MISDIDLTWLYYTRIELTKLTVLLYSSNVVSEESVRCKNSWIWISKWGQEYLQLHITSEWTTTKRHRSYYTQCTTLFICILYIFGEISPAKEVFVWVCVILHMRNMCFQAMLALWWNDIAKSRSEHLDWEHLGEMQAYIGFSSKTGSVIRHWWYQMEDRQRGVLRKRLWDRQFWS